MPITLVKGKFESKFMMITPHTLVEAGLYPDEPSVIREALQVLWQERPRLRLDWAVYQYQIRPISLAKAAALANVSFDRMKDILVQRGIQPRLGAENIEQARQELAVVEMILNQSNTLCQS